MLTGRVPFEAGNAMALLLKHVTERPRPMAELRPDTPRGLRETIERALMKAPEDRWPTAAAFRDALSSTESLGPVWRADQREPVRYTSPRPDGSRRVAAVARRPLTRDDRDSSLTARNDKLSDLVLEPPHFAALTPAQRKDLRLWHGRVNLLDRIKAMRGYALLTLGATVGGMVGFAFGVAEVPPFVLAPIVPIYMWTKLWRRGKSLRESGLKLRQLFPPTAWVIRRRQVTTQQHLEKLAPRMVLDSPEGGVIRRAVEDRTAILEIFAKLSKPDRSLLPDLESTAKSLVERVAHLAQVIHRLDESIDPDLARELDARIAIVERESGSSDGERQLGLLRRQRASLEELVQQRAALARQLESAGLALGNLRLDLIKLRSSGLQSALSDVTSATQEARALSKDIDAVLAAASEMRSL
jgi:serine/threonine-protein kinase